MVSTIAYFSDWTYCKSRGINPYPSQTGAARCTAKASTCKSSSVYAILVTPRVRPDTDTASNDYPMQQTPMVSRCKIRSISGFKKLLGKSCGVFTAGKPGTQYLFPSPSCCCGFAPSLRSHHFSNSVSPLRACRRGFKQSPISVCLAVLPLTLSLSRHYYSTRVCAHSHPARICC